MRPEPAPRAACAAIATFCHTASHALRVFSRRLCQALPTLRRSRAPGAALQQAVARGDALDERAAPALAQQPRAVGVALVRQQAAIEAPPMQTTRVAEHIEESAAADGTGLLLRCLRRGLGEIRAATGLPDASDEDVAAAFVKRYLSDLTLTKLSKLAVMFEEYAQHADPDDHVCVMARAIHWGAQMRRLQLEIQWFGPNEPIAGAGSLVEMAKSYQDYAIACRHLGAPPDESVAKPIQAFVDRFNNWAEDNTLDEMGTMLASVALDTLAEPLPRALRSSAA